MPYSGDEGPTYDSLTIMQKMELVRTSRNSLKTSLTNKGKTPTTNIRTYSALVDTLTNTSDADAVAENIDSGKTAYVNGVKLTGTSTKVDTSDANATADALLLYRTAYVNGEKIVGTLEHAGAVSTIVSEESQITIPDDLTSDEYFHLTANIDMIKSYVISNDTISEMLVDINVFASKIGLTSDKIKAGETILGITGTYETDLSELEAIADDILGETAQQGGSHSG